MTHLVRAESIWFPLMFERDARTGSCCTAHPAPPETTPDFAKDIAITAELLVLARNIINNGDDPASEDLATRTVIPGNVNVVTRFLMRILKPYAMMRPSRMPV